MKNNYISSNGIFSREGLLEIIDKYLDLNIIADYPSPIYAAAVNLKTIGVVYYRACLLKTVKFDKSFGSHKHYIGISQNVVVHCEGLP